MVVEVKLCSDEVTYTYREILIWETWHYGVVLKTACTYNEVRLYSVYAWQHKVTSVILTMYGTCTWNFQILYKHVWLQLTNYQQSFGFTVVKGRPYFSLCWVPVLGAHFLPSTDIWALTWENQQSWFSTRSDTNKPAYSHRNRLEVWTFGIKKKRDCSIRVMKRKALISCAVTA